MSTDKKPEDQITEAPAVEVDETQLDDAAGGGTAWPGGVNVALADGSVRLADGSVRLADGSVRFVSDSIG